MRPKVPTKRGVTYATMRRRLMLQDAQPAAHVAVDVLRRDRWSRVGLDHRFEMPMFALVLAWCRSL